MEFIHKTVLLKEAVDALNCTNGKIYIDGTLGGGGHSFDIASKIQPDGKLFSFDVDDEAIEAATDKLKDFNNVTIVKSSYINIPEKLKEQGIDKISGGILFDLGASYHQLTAQERGFSFSKEAFLDMRFNKDAELTAYDVINNYSEEKLADIFYYYGEERYSRRVAKKIAEKRKVSPIKTTTDLSEIVKSCIGFSKEKIHPATRVFQALRIEVNSELKNIETTLQQIIHLLDKDARIVVISFHSLEDRLVKNTFRDFSSNCKCPREKLICECAPAQLKVITKKPIIPSPEEIEQNPAARSAKMRIAEKLN